MDAKVTLSFNKEVIEKAKAFAAAHHISLSRLLEYMLRKATSGEFKDLEDLPIADWVNEVAEGAAVYLTRPPSRKSRKNEYLNSRK
jgi:hypothetical protein